MKVDQWLLCNLCRNISLRLYILHLLHRSVVGVHVSAVMLVVVELHDLAGDGWLECAIVVCKSYNASAFTSIRASRAMPI